MRYVFPVKLTEDEDGNWLAVSRDVPEALADGATAGEALRAMSDALGAALAGYVLEGREIPEPTAATRHERPVPVAPLVAAKLALCGAMNDQGISNVALADLLGVSEGAVRRLVDPDHASRLDRVVSALGALGRGLAIEDLDQAA